MFKLIAAMTNCDKAGVVLTSRVCVRAVIDPSSSYPNCRVYSKPLNFFKGGALDHTVFASVSEGEENDLI